MSDTSNREENFNSSSLGRRPHLQGFGGVVDPGLGKRTNMGTDHRDSLRVLYTGRHAREEFSSGANRPKDTRWWRRTMKFFKDNRPHSGAARRLSVWVIVCVLVGMAPAAAQAVNHL